MIRLSKWNYIYMSILLLIPVILCLFIKEVQLKISVIALFLTLLGWHVNSLFSISLQNKAQLNSFMNDVKNNLVGELETCSVAFVGCNTTESKRDRM